MKSTGNPARTKQVGKRPATYARLIFRIIEENLVGENLEHFWAVHHEGVRRGELLSESELFSAPYIDEKHWLNLLLLGLRDDVMGKRMPILMAPYHKIEAAGPAAAMMMSADSIRAFIEPMCRYNPALDPTLIMGRETIPGGVRIIAHYDGLEGNVADCFLYSGLNMLEDAMIRMALWSGEPKPTITVNAPQPAYHQAVRDLFYSEVFWDGDPKRAGTGWAIDIPDKLLDVPNYLANAELHQLSCEMLDLMIRERAALVASALEAGEVGGPQTELVRSALSTALTLLSQGQVSDIMNCEPRTLQKRLQREGSSWSELVTEEFTKRVEPSVLNGEPSKNIAERIGMTESNFYRKFQKLYGATPKQWIISQQELSHAEKIEATRVAARKMRRQ